MWLEAFELKEKQCMTFDIIKMGALTGPLSHYNKYYEVNIFRNWLCIVFFY